MLELVIALISTVLGALGGGYVGYRFAKVQTVENQKSKREFLVALLLEELRSLPNHYPARYEVGKVFFSAHLELAALPRLLSDDVLTYRQHSNLIRALLNLQIVLGLYNTRIAVVNLAQNVGSISDETHRQMYEIVQLDYGKVIAAKTMVIEILAASDLGVKTKAA